MKAVGYIRVSRKPKKGEEPDSLEDQKEKIEAYCTAKNWELVKTFQDKGISGHASDNRPGLIKLLDDARNRKFNAVVVKYLDRFGRNTIEIFDNVKTLKDHNITFASVTEGFDLSTPAGGLVFKIMAVLAEYERERIRERIMDTKKQKASDGIPPMRESQLPYGRTMLRDANGKYTGKFTPIPEKVKAIQWAANEYLTTDTSLQKLADQFPSKFGFKISPQYIRIVWLERSTDKWKIDFKENGEVIETHEFKVPRLLEDETIDALKEKLKTGRTGLRTKVKKYALNDFLKCGECGARYTGQATTKKSKLRYYKHRYGCGNPDCVTYLPLDVFERKLFTVLFDHFYDWPSFKKAIEHNFDPKTQKQWERERKNHEKQLKATEKELENVILGKSTFKTARAKKMLQKKEAELDAKIKHHTKELRDRVQWLGKIPKTADMDKMRKRYLKEFKSVEHMVKMDYDQKYSMLAWLFPQQGTPPTIRPESVNKRLKRIIGNKYGIYVNREGKKGWNVTLFGPFFLQSQAFKKSSKGAENAQKSKSEDSYYKSEYIAKHDRSYP